MSLSSASIRTGVVQTIACGAAINFFAKEHVFVVTMSPVTLADYEGQPGSNLY